MPTSKKPRKPKAAPKQSPAEVLMSRLTGAMLDGDLQAFDAAYEDLTELIGVDPSIDPDILHDLDAMRGEMVETEAAQAEIDAALWSGNLERAEALEAVLYDDIDDDEGPEDGVIDLTVDPYADLAAGKPGAVEALLAARADLNAPLGPDPRPALFAALEAPNRSPETVERLIRAGADPLAIIEEDGTTAMVWALMAKDMADFDSDSEGRLFDLLLRHGADPDEGCGDFGSVLNRAIVLGLPAHVTALLEAGAGISTVAPYDFAVYDLAHAPALVLAGPKPDVVTLLLEAGADPLSLGTFDQTPLDFVTAAAADARARQTADDPWTQAHATALTQSASLLQDWVSRRPTFRN
jgi:ankyrin repeat protein